MQPGEDLGVLHGQQRQRNTALRTDRDLHSIGLHAAVATEAGSANVDRFHHRAPTTNPGSIGDEPGTAIPQLPNIGCCSADVGKDEVVESSE